MTEDRAGIVGSLSTGNTHGITDPEPANRLLADVQPLVVSGIPALQELIRWTLGESPTDDFPSLPGDWPSRKFYWRKALRARFNALHGIAEPTC